MLLKLSSTHIVPNILRLFNNDTVGFSGVSKYFKDLTLAGKLFEYENVSSHATEKSGFVETRT